MGEHSSIYGSIFHTPSMISNDMSRLCLHHLNDYAAVFSFAYACRKYYDFNRALWQHALAIPEDRTSRQSESLSEKCTKCTRKRKIRVEQAAGFHKPNFGRLLARLSPLIRYNGWWWLS